MTIGSGFQRSRNSLTFGRGRAWPRIERQLAGQAVIAQKPAMRSGAWRGKHVEVAAEMKHRGTRAHRNGGNQTVHQFANGFSAASAQTMERCGFLIIQRLRRNSHRRSQGTPKTAQVPFVPRTCKNHHANRITNSNLPVQQLSDIVTCR